jgi:nitrous-oxide reductase
MVVAGKLTRRLFGFEKLMKAMSQNGIPITRRAGAAPGRRKEAQVELGLGPLHTVYDNQGYAYTSLFLDSAVARWTLGGDFADQHPEEPWTLVAKIPVQYNIGHITAAEGDTVSPDGKYVVALNKWAIDRFQNVGPLLPQNFQLIDISKTVPTCRSFTICLSAAASHTAQMIKQTQTQEVYPEIGWIPRPAVSPTVKPARKGGAQWQNVEIDDGHSLHYP